MTRLLADNDALRTANQRLATEVRSLRSGDAADSLRHDAAPGETSADRDAANRYTSGQSPMGQFPLLRAPRGTGARQRTPWTVPGDAGARSAPPRHGSQPDETVDLPGNRTAWQFADQPESLPENQPESRADQPESQPDQPESQPDQQSAPRSVYDALFPESETTPDIVPDPTVWDVVYASVPENYSIPDADFAAYLAASLEDDATAQSNAS